MKQRKSKVCRRGSLEEKLYHVWYNMIDRCHNPTHKAYRRYGGRGIFVCFGWRSFQNFSEWAAQGYKQGLWLDRKDNDKGYDPDNCQWITPNESRDNVRGTMTITAFGETKTVANWSRDPRCAVTRDTLRARIKLGHNPELSITNPAGALK